MTIQDIKNLNPCYCPTRYLPENWTGTVRDILLIEECPVKDRLWVALRLAPREVVEIFAIDCAFSAANADYAAYAAANAADYADYAADYAANAAYAAANAADYAAANADYAAANSADYAAYIAVNAVERENQIDALLMLLEEPEDVL